MYDLAVFIGRFQPFHKGHLHNIIQALKFSDRILINIGSSFNAPNIKNPFTFEQRKQMIKSDLEAVEIDLSRIVIEPLADYYYQEEKWQQALRQNVSKHSKITDKVAIVGHEKDASSYYLKSFAEWGFIPVDNYKSYNATDFRKEYYNGNILINYMCSDDVGVGTHGFLNKFAGTSEFTNLQEEYFAIKKYKQRWQTSPYMPILTTVDALVIVNDHILLIQRNNTPGKGLWALPGGFVDSGEFIAQATTRELYEETSIDLSLEQLAFAKRGSFVFDYPSRSVRGQTITHASLFVFESMESLPTIKASDDAKSTKWVHIHSIAKDFYARMFEDHYQIITILLEKCGKNI
ncbi:bifunctional nicotinamide-nucleotide adenylyltransferase/Nudix hydroxylase [Francisellaceae bacterium CB299]